MGKNIAVRFLTLNKAKFRHLFKKMRLLNLPLVCSFVLRTFSSRFGVSLSPLLFQKKTQNGWKKSEEQKKTPEVSLIDSFF